MSKHRATANKTLPYEVVYDNGGLIAVVVTCGPYTQRMQGMDYFWVAGNEFGCYIEPNPLKLWWETFVRWWKGHYFTVYHGAKSASWQYTPDGIIDTGGKRPPKDADIMVGDMIPDNRARELGLL